MCASSATTRNSARVMCAHTLKAVTPRCAQYATVSRASLAPLSLKLRGRRQARRETAPLSSICNPARLHEATRERRHSVAQVSSGLPFYWSTADDRLPGAGKVAAESIAAPQGAGCSGGPLVADALPPGRGEAAYLESMAPAQPRLRPRCRANLRRPGRGTRPPLFEPRHLRPNAPGAASLLLWADAVRGKRRALVCCAPSHRARRRLPPVTGPRSGGSLDISRRRPRGSSAGASGRFRPVERCSPPGASGVGFGARSLKLPVGCRVRV